MLLRGLLATYGFGRGMTYHVADEEQVDLDTPKDKYDSLTHPSTNDYDPCRNEELLEIAAPVRNKGKASRQQVKRVLLALCRGRFLTPKQMGELLNRSPQGEQERYIKPMLEECSERIG